MDIAEIFYLTATVVFVLFGVIMLFIGYQVYKLSKIIKVYVKAIQKGISFISTARYGLQAAILNWIINVLGGRGGDDHETKR